MASWAIYIYVLNCKAQQWTLYKNDLSQQLCCSFVHQRVTCSTTFYCTKKSNKCCKSCGSLQQRSSSTLFSHPIRITSSS
mmetsp:Transcript_14508/g.20756  ORF Transcript_14508/g.20756 Transcript_14508/m.20756 type:complete len:80 (+) Transcript_14508:471-710(+)